MVQHGYIDGDRGFKFSVSTPPFASEDFHLGNRPSQREFWYRLAREGTKCQMVALKFMLLRRRYFLWKMNR